MKGSIYSHKLMYEGCLELIYRCLSNDMYTKLNYMKIPHGEITCVYEKTYMTIV